MRVVADMCSRPAAAGHWRAIAAGLGCRNARNVRACGDTQSLADSRAFRPCSFQEPHAAAAPVDKPGALPSSVPSQAWHGRCAELPSAHLRCTTFLLLSKTRVLHETDMTCWRLPALAAGRCSYRRCAHCHRTVKCVREMRKLAHSRVRPRKVACTSAVNAAVAEESGNHQGTDCSQTSNFVRHVQPRQQA